MIVGDQVATGEIHAVGEGIGALTAAYTGFAPPLLAAYRSGQRTNAETARMTSIHATTAFVLLLSLTALLRPLSAHTAVYVMRTAS